MRAKTAVGILFLIAGVISVFIFVYAYISIIFSILLLLIGIILLLPKPGTRTSKIQIAITLLVFIFIFILAFFNSDGGTLSNACIPQSGFTCSTPVYSHATGNVIFTIGQNTGADWANTTFVLLNATNFGTFQSTGAFPTGLTTSPSVAMNSGDTVQVSLPVSSPSATQVGVDITGWVWASYTVSGNSTTQHAEIGAMTAKAV